MNVCLIFVDLILFRMGMLLKNFMSCLVRFSLRVFLVDIIYWSEWKELGEYELMILVKKFGIL